MFCIVASHVITRLIRAALVCWGLAQKLGPLVVYGKAICVCAPKQHSDCLRMPEI